MSIPGTVLRFGLYLLILAFMFYLGTLAVFLGWIVEALT